MCGEPLPSATVSVQIVGERPFIVDEVDQRHARVIAAFAMLPPAAFCLVVQRMNAWRLEPAAFRGENALALRFLYATIREIFRE